MKTEVTYNRPHIEQHSEVKISGHTDSTLDHYVYLSYKGNSEHLEDIKLILTNTYQKLMNITDEQE